MYSLISPKKVSRIVKQVETESKTVVKKAENSVKTIEKAYKSSELWLHVVLQVLSWLTVAVASDPTVKIGALSLSGVLAGVYTWSRTHLKSL